MKVGGLVVIGDRISMYPGEEFLMGNGRKHAEGVSVSGAVFQWDSEPSSS